MMHAITCAMFPDNWRGLLAHKLRARCSQPFRGLLLVVAVLLAGTSVVHAATATWNPNSDPDIAGYILSYGTLPGVHPTSIDVGNITTWRLTTLTPGQIYYFVLLTQPANQTSAENATVSLQLLASDPDGDVLSYSATGLPASLAINAATGLISGTLPVGSAGAYSVTATVSDGSLTNSKTFTWTVTNTNRPPTLTQPANRTSAKNATVSLQLVASDPDGDRLTYSATGLPAPLTVSAATGLISETLVSTSVGSHTVTATVSDGTLSSSQTFIWTVTNVAPALSRIDFDGDGKTDITVFSPSTGTWRMLQSSTSNTASVARVWGIATDRPVPGDYDGDRKTDLAVYRPANGTWYILQSSTNYTTSVAVPWGISTDIPAPGDYDGDGKTDPAVYRPSTGMWYVLQSSTNYATSVSFAWGSGTDVPVPGDYDGDGKADPAVFRSTGDWTILLSSTNYATSVVVPWGLSTDVPVRGLP